MSEETPTIRIPVLMPVSFNEDGGKLIVTIPPSLPSASVVAVDRIAHGLLERREIQIQCRTIETDFLIKQLEDRPDYTWEGLVLVNYVMPKESVQQMTHTLDMPGPIHIQPMGQVEDQGLTYLTIKAWYGQ